MDHELERDPGPTVELAIDVELVEGVQAADNVIVRWLLGLLDAPNPDVP